MAVSHFTHTLHGRIQGGPISLTLSRAEAATIIRKWNCALRRGARGHRTYFIMEVHRGKAWDRLIVETHQHRARKRRQKPPAMRFATLPANA